MRRAGWFMLAMLFVFTGLGVGVYAFWQATHQPADTSANQNTPKTSQLIGTKLKNFTPVPHIDTLQSIDTKVGTGDTVQLGDTVTVIYSGAVASTGVIFDSNEDTQPAQLSLSQVIAGWTDGIPGMKVGGQRRLLIPASAAYGANPPAGSGIPANADLVFDITLLATARAKSQ